MLFVSTYELVACALFLIFYEAHLSHLLVRNVSCFSTGTTRADKLRKLRRLQMWLERLDKEVIEPWEELHKEFFALAEKWGLMEPDLARTPKDDDPIARTPSILSPITTTPKVFIPIATKPRRLNDRLFVYTPKRQVFVKVSRKEKTPRSSNRNLRTQTSPRNTMKSSPQRRTPDQHDENELDMTKLDELNKSAVNSSGDSHWVPQPRHPLSPIYCNKASRRYPASLFPGSVSLGSTE